VAAAADDPTRQFAWEQGQIDYLGVDKFENIQKQLDASMSNPLPPEPSKKIPFQVVKSPLLCSETTLESS